MKKLLCALVALLTLLCGCSAPADPAQATPEPEQGMEFSDSTLVRREDVDTLLICAVGYDDAGYSKLTSLSLLVREPSGSVSLLTIPKDTRVWVEQYDAQGAYSYCKYGPISAVYHAAESAGLAERKTVCLDDDRRAHLLDVGNRLVAVLKDRILRRRDVVLCHQLLGKRLGALDDCGVLVRTECAESCLLQRINHAECERIVRRYNDQIRVVLLGERNHTVDVGRLDVDAFRSRSDAAVARCAPDLIYLRALCERHADGVLTSAAANNQYLHWMFPPFPPSCAD